MKNIRIAYIEVNKPLENSIMEIAIDYPAYKNTRQCYLYELFYFDDLKRLIYNREEEILKFGIYNGDLSPFFMRVQNDLFLEIQEYLINKTEYEEHKFNDELSLFNAIINLYRNDPKTWEL